MLSERLKKEGLGFEKMSNDSIKEGFGALDASIKTFVLAMSSMQRRGVASAEEIEAYAIEALEKYEAKIYAMGDMEYVVYLMKAALE